MDALTFITCGSVDDGKSTLIGRLLMDSQTVLSDQLASASRNSLNTGHAQQPDLAAFTDGLQAEREQGITIDVAWRYCATPARKFIIGDTPGHLQYTRNMVTAATNADAAVVLVDATKLDWRNAQLALLAQTRRHSLLVNRLRVPSVVFAVNKLDAVDDAAAAFANISAALHRFAHQAGIQHAATVPVSALLGFNVVHANHGWAGYKGPSLLSLLETLPTVAQADAAQAVQTAEAAGQVNSALPTHLAVQWVEVNHAANRSDKGDKGHNDPTTTHQGRRIYWGRLAAGQLRVGQKLQCNGHVAAVARLLATTRQPLPQASSAQQLGASYGVVLDCDIDVSRGDWLLSDNASVGSQQATATVAWLDEQPLAIGRTYWALLGHRWVKAKVSAINHRIDIDTLATQPAQALDANSIGQVQLQFQAKLPVQPYRLSRWLGSLILVNTASHATAGAVLIDG